MMRKAFEQAVEAAYKRADGYNRGSQIKSISK
jgi:hypothetical protein